MLTIPQQFSPYGWLLDDPISLEQFENTSYYLSREETTPTSEYSNIDLHSPSSTQAKYGEFTSFIDELVHHGDDNKTVKKLNHNASERNRRKKINNLYTTLRSLLPLEDQSGKLSIPATISGVVKYIPELQKEVEQLVRKKESFMSKISRQEESYKLNFKDPKEIKSTKRSSHAISATEISNKEIVIQISIPKTEKGILVSESILSLEQEGFLVLSVSCFESSQERVFYNLHLQAQESQVMDVKLLTEKLWSLTFFEKTDKIILT